MQTGRIQRTLGWAGLVLGAVWLGAILAWTALYSGVLVVSAALQPSDIRHEAAYAYIASARLNGTPFFFLSNRWQQSGGVLAFETEGAQVSRQLGPPHARTPEIARRGAGHFAVRDKQVVFSAIDGSDPRINGRTYVLVGTAVPERWLILAGLGGLILGMTLSWLGRVHLFGNGKLVFGCVTLATSVGVITALAPIASSLGVGATLTESLAPLPLLLGCAVVLREMLRAAHKDADTRPLGREVLCIIGVAAALFMAIVTSGLLQGSHRAIVTSIAPVKDRAYQYPVAGMPLLLAFAGDEARLLNSRTLVSDARGPLINGQNDEHILSLSDGRASFWGRTARFSLRSPGGIHDPANAISISGSLKIAFDLAALLCLAMLASMVAFGRERIGVPSRAASGARGATGAMDGRRILGGLVLAGVGLAALMMQERISPPPSTKLWLGGPFLWTQSLSLAAALLTMLLLPWSGKNPQYSVRSKWHLSVLLYAAALFVPFLGILNNWLSITQTNSASITALHILGMLQASDSMGYLTGALDLLTGGWLNDWNSRRPLTSTLTALRILIAGPHLTGVMLLGALFIGLCQMLATREVLRTAGSIAALGFLIASGSFISEWTPTTMSEGTGFALGLLALAALLAAWRTDSVILFALGIAALATALMARAGPQLVLPCLVLAGVAIQWPRGKARASLWLAVGLGAAALGLAHSPYLVKTLHGSSGMIQSNFSYTLYGLAVGGKGWAQVFADHPELFAAGVTEVAEPSIYRYALAEIAREPSRIVGAVLREIQQIPGFFASFFDPVLLNVWLMAGVAAVVLAMRSRGGLLGCAGILGIVASSPLILTDGGRRVFAAVVPILALLVGIGLDAMLKLGRGLARGETVRSELVSLSQPQWERDTNRAYGFVREPSFWAGMMMIAVILMAPVIISPKQRQITGKLPEIAACRPGEYQLVLGRAVMLELFHILPDGSERAGFLPDIQRADMLRLAQSFDEPFHRALAGLKTPTMLHFAVRMTLPSDLTAVAPVLVAVPSEMRLDTSGDLIATCADKAGITDQNRVGGLEVYEVRSSAPIHVLPRP